MSESRLALANSLRLSKYSHTSGPPHGPQDFASEIAKRRFPKTDYCQSSGVGKSPFSLD